MRQDCSSEHYPFLDGLRAVAVLGVLLFHYNLGYVTGGYVGVDIFFVLSGFLITGVIDTRLQSNTFSFFYFYERRCRRILPALFVMAGFSVLTALLLLMPYDFRNFSQSLKGAALFYSNMVFAHSSGYFATPLSTRPLLHTWSLAVEEQFYLLYPPALYALRRGFKENRKAFHASIAAMFCFSLLANLILTAANPDKAFYILPTRAWELLSGAVLFLVLRHISLSALMAEAFALAGAACVAVCYFVYSRNTLFPGWAALLPCLGAVLLIWPNLQRETAVGRALSSRPLITIGLISYGLYIYHWPILVFTRYYLDRPLVMPEAFAAITLTFVLSAASYRLVEMPIRSGTVLSGQGRVFVFSLAGIMIITSFALSGLRSGGFPFRFNNEVLQYAAGDNDFPDWERRMPRFEDLDEKTVPRIGAVTAAAPSFLLWGDSHAEALAPAIESRAKALGVSGLYVEYSGCLPLIGVARLDHAPKNAPCARVGDKVLAFVEKNQIRTVIMAGRWDDIEGWERDSIEAGQPEAVVAYTMPNGRRLMRGAAFAPAFQETIARLRALGVHVWVVEQVPPQLVDIPSALAKAVYLGRDITELARPYGDIAVRRRPADAVFAPFRNDPGLSFLDPADRLCPKKTVCIISDKGHALYRDSNHLSIYGSLWIQDMFDPALMAGRQSPDDPAHSALRR